MERGIAGGDCVQNTLYKSLNELIGIVSRKENTALLRREKERKSFKTSQGNDRAMGGTKKGVAMEVSQPTSAPASAL